MGVACKCLNVKIHLRTGPFPANHQQWGGVFYEGRAGIAEELYEGTLDAGGIVVEQPLLIRQVDVQSSSANPATKDSSRDCQNPSQFLTNKWRQIQCLNCGLWTCSSLLSSSGVTASGQSTIVLLSSHILTRDKWTSVTSSSHYSPALRFAVSPDGSLAEGPSIGTSAVSPSALGANGSLLVAGLAAGVDSQIDRFLRQEKVNMEARVRQFIEEEKRQLEAVTLRAKCDREKLLSVWSSRVGVNPSSFSDPDAHMVTGDHMTDVTFNHFNASASTPPVGDSSVGVQRLALDLTPPDTPRDMSGREDSAELGESNTASGDVDIGEEAGPAGDAVDTLGPLPSPKGFIDRSELASRFKNRRRAASANAVPRLGTSLDAEGLFMLDEFNDSDDLGAARDTRKTNTRSRFSSGIEPLSTLTSMRQGPDSHDLDSDDDPSPHRSDENVDVGDGEGTPDDDEAFVYGGAGIAHSLPITVPRNGRQTDYGAWSEARPVPLGDNRMDTSVDSPQPGVAPENIAESIRALARSVTMSFVDPDEQFLMDVPRPRLRSFKDL